MDNFIQSASLGQEQPVQTSAEEEQQNLIRALQKLQHRELDAGFLDKPLQQEELAQPYLSFAIAGEPFILSSRYFCEVFSDIPIAPLPNAPGILLGLANLRGLLLPVYQLHHLLSPAGSHGLSPGASALKKKFVLVIGKGERAVGLLIDALPVSVSLVLPGGHALANALPHLQLPTLAKTYVLPDKTLALLEPEQLAEHLLQMADTAEPHIRQ